MIETVTALAALMISIQSWMVLFETGRSWTFPVKYTITDVQLLQNKPSCCSYVMSGAIILRANDNVYLIKN